MRLGLLEVVAPIQRIKPRVEQELGPVAVAHDEAPRREAVLVLRQREVDLLAAQVREGADDAVGRDDGLVLDHQGVHLLRGHDLLDRQRRVHDQRVLVQEPEVLGVRVIVQGVAHRGQFGPGDRRAGEVVVADGGEEGRVA